MSLDPLINKVKSTKVTLGTVLSVAVVAVPLWTTGYMYKSGIDEAIAFAKDRKDYEARIIQLETDVENLFEDLDIALGRD